MIRGCVPKKLLVYGSHFAEELQDAANYGWTVEKMSFDWPTLRDAVLKDVDCLLSPVAPTTAYKIGEKTMSPLEMYLGDIDTVPVNIAGIPGLSLPCGLDRAGLPVGVQLMGATFSEPLLYRVGYALEEALGEICKEATL